ncbi:flagellar biosynthesis chaperone FliJ [Natronocella acetinitrilica]|uniref:Flagellar biosynthesis chaperone FliJ n=1 Tax=Natronocella acetinitrilica TaxID=414046 RepID=A0AAE3G4X3_9GAMM|nr:flagellar biosynthesis chaperone FliJ [Natronocella acetinitrilica]
MNSASLSDTNPSALSIQRCGLWSTILAAAVLAGCASGGGEPRLESRDRGSAEVEDLYVVDCLLPGQVRRVGGMTYLTPRRPTRTTVQDCRIRGGEYVAYDRADYRTALNVWLERAEGGDAEAQNYVGEIFEKGLGRDPDYVSAATWYRRAADQGYSRAQINLGFLYEQGLGVQQDTATALNYYRQASGVSEDDLVFRSEMDGEIAELRAQLDAQIAQADQQVNTLQQQLQRLVDERDAMQRRVEEAESGGDDAGAADPEESERLSTELAGARLQIETLEQLFQRARDERDELAQQLSELPEPTEETIAEAEEDRPALERPEIGAAIAGGIDFGRYYALVIGNQEYQYLDDLESPLTDAERVHRLLEERYGFNVTFLPNADQYQIMNALNDLHDRVGPRDNLLVYYAGHGNMSGGRESGSRQRGYWLPVDAEAERLVRWINNAVISDHLDRIRARSILVVADSLYGSTMAAESSALLLGSGQSALTEDSIRAGLDRRSRIVISSGGERPVPDSVDRPHSLFSRSLIDALEENDGVMRENMLFARVAVNVRRRSGGDGSPPQTPEMRPIRAAGHEGGDFYFVPVSDQRTAVGR